MNYNAFYAAVVGDATHQLGDNFYAIIHLFCSRAVAVNGSAQFTSAKLT